MRPPVLQQLIRSDSFPRTRCYTLTVALGNRNDNLFFDTGTYTLDLLANGVSVAERNFAGDLIAHGTFVDVSTSFVSLVSAH